MATDDIRTQANALARRYFAGDDRLLPELMDIYRALVEAAARRILRSSTDVEDAVQETWLSFVRNGHAIHDRDRVGAWLWAVSQNNARRILRQAKRMGAAGDALSVGADRAEVIDFDLALVQNERIMALGAAAESLTDSDRRILDLFLDERDLDYREISALSGRPIGSLGPTRERIIRKMRATQPMANLLAAS